MYKVGGKNILTKKEEEERFFDRKATAITTVTVTAANVRSVQPSFGAFQLPKWLGNCTF